MDPRIKKAFNELKKALNVPSVPIQTYPTKEGMLHKVQFALSMLPEQFKDFQNVLSPNELLFECKLLVPKTEEIISLNEIPVIINYWKFNSSATTIGVYGGVRDGIMIVRTNTLTGLPKKYFDRSKYLEKVEHATLFKNFVKVAKKTLDGFYNSLYGVYSLYTDKNIFALFEENRKLDDKLYKFSQEINEQKSIINNKINTIIKKNVNMYNDF